MMKKTLSFIREHFLLILVFLLALIMRLMLTKFGFHDDLITNAGWGEWIYKNGPRGFYENNVWIYSWPTQPPVISWLYSFNYDIYQRLLWCFNYSSQFIQHHQLMPDLFGWWFDFVKWFSLTLWGETSFHLGFLITMKLPAILADICLGFIVFLIVKKNITRSLLPVFLYLFMPFSWYISALWGQYDQFSTLLLIISFLLLNKRSFVFSALFMFFAGQVKPTVIYFIPLYVFYFFYQKPKILSLILSFISVLIIFWLITAPFADRDPFSYTKQVMYQKVFFSERFNGLASRALNLWQLLAPQGGRSYFNYIGLPAYLWGYLLLTFFYIWSFVSIFIKNDLKHLIKSIFLVAGGSYIFGTGMLDRYFFPAAVSLIILTVYYPKLLRYCFIIITLFSINLFYSWGFPILEKSHAWENNYLIQILSLAQLITFVLCLLKIGLAEDFLWFKKTFVTYLKQKVIKQI